MRAAFERHAGRRGGGRDRDGVGEGASGQRRGEGGEPLVRPGGQNGGHERAALGGRLEPALAGRLEGGGEIGDVGERGRIVRGSSPPGMGEQDRIAAAGAVAENVAEPGFERGGVGHRAVLDRPFEAVAVGVGADREGGRQPGEQAKERGGGQCIRRPGALAILLSLRTGRAGSAMCGDCADASWPCSCS